MLHLLPVAGLTLLIAGFNPTRIDTANRHLLLGRLTALDLAAQAIGIVAMVVLAWIMVSVWALVLGAIVGSFAKLGLTWACLPGQRNRLHWERTAGAELLHFGKWILLSTLCGFLLAQGDKAVLGSVLTKEALGIYNIGYFLASFPALLAGMVISRIMIPVYREHPPSASAANARRMRRLRLGLTVTVLLLLALMALAGPWLVKLMFDDRYLAAGMIVTLVALAQMPGIIGLSYDQSALAAGDGRGFFVLLACRAAVHLAALIFGAQWAGAAGALLGQAIAATLVHPLIARLARRHGAWDLWHDLGAFGLMLCLGAMVLAVHGATLVPMFVVSK
jgi:O-antigen/teichoic acid export membrane protein